MGTGEINSTKIQGVKKAQGIYNPLPKRLYTLNEAAHYLGRTLWSMRELIWKGSIPIVREGKRIFIDINDLNLYVTKHKTTYV
jgi:excisionase family DNA binding protein